MQSAVHHPETVMTGLVGHLKMTLIPDHPEMTGVVVVIHSQRETVGEAVVAAAAEMVVVVEMILAGMPHGSKVAAGEIVNVNVVLMMVVHGEDPL